MQEQIIGVSEYLDEQEQISITDDLVREVKATIEDAWDFHREFRQWNTLASRDAIKHFAWGMGDDNPLWLDEEYARGTKYGCILAPPTFLYSIDHTVIQHPGLCRLHHINAGTDWEWFQVIRADDRFTVECKLLDVIDQQGKNVQRMLLQIGEVVYRNQKNEVVAKAIGKQWAMPGGTVKGGLSYAARPSYRYSRQELEEIVTAVLSEERRGPLPRYWEEVNVGDELTPVVKGPLAMSDMICYYCAIGTHHRAHELYLKKRRTNPEDSMMENIARGHIDPSRAGEGGMPGQFDNGLVRTSWGVHLLTNWMGDDAFLKTLSVQIRRPNIIGDTTWWKGKVSRKYAEDNVKLVECEIWTENQLKDVTAKGKATIILPTKEQ